ncbi:MAG: hypothetical protein HYW15_03125 [Candidatus Giovannonibacteria bacterium]|nr:MAG: hypothetical protein HYW15_03125 [Candidatus Giovannonibacteria bacterium]
MNIFVSSLFDVFNAAACLVSASRLRRSHKQKPNVLVRDFFYFYLLFTVFFALLAAPVIFHGDLKIVQLFFVFGHLILYLALSYFIRILFALIGWRKFLLPLQLFLAAAGVVVFWVSLRSGDAARIWEIGLAGQRLIAFSHGGAPWARLLIGLIGGFSGVFFALIMFVRSLRLEDKFLRRRSRWLSYGTFVLGLAALSAFEFSVFSFYSFGIVVAAEVLAISGLLLMLKGIFYGRDTGRRNGGVA